MKNVDLPWRRCPHRDLSIEMVVKDSQQRANISCIRTPVLVSWNRFFHMQITRFSFLIRPFGKEAVPCPSSDGTDRLPAMRTARPGAQMHLRRSNAITLSADVEEMSRGPYCRLVGAHFQEQVEPQMASRCPGR